MKKTNNMIRIVSAIMILLSVFAVGAEADWYDEVSGGSYAPIEGDSYIADTFCGVEAFYSESSYYYQCNELIMRFYREAYGLEVMAYENTGLIMVSKGYKFENPSQPKKGDIIYSPSTFRKGRGDHWAIVKDYSNGVITLFEQNVVWEDNGVKKAGTGRKLKFPSDYYYLYTPVSLPGFADPVLPGITETSTATTAKATTTAKPTTTTKPTTTAKSTTTAKPTTVKETSKPVTTDKAAAVTAAASTELKITDTSVTGTTAETVITQVETAGTAADTSTEHENSGKETVSDNYSEESSEIKTVNESALQAETENQVKNNTPKRIIIPCTAVLIVATAAAVLISVIKKKQPK